MGVVVDAIDLIAASSSGDPADISGAGSDNVLTRVRLRDGIDQESKGSGVAGNNHVGGSVASNFGTFSTARKAKSDDSSLRDGDLTGGKRSAGDLASRVGSLTHSLVISTVSSGQRRAQLKSIGLSLQKQEEL